MSRAKTLSKARAQSRKRPNLTAPPRTGTFLAGKNLNTVFCVLLAAATIALYSPVLGYSFVVLDDREYVIANSHIHGGLGWDTIKWTFTSTTAANWHPLTWLSHALDYQLFALNPTGHHLDSVLIHALNAVVLFLLLAWVTKRVGPSLLVAALFAVHPINVESVAWVAERKNVLSTLLFLLAIGAYVRYAQKPDWRRYLLVAALFVAGLGQAHGHYPAFCPVAAGLLAAWQNSWQSAFRCRRAAVGSLETAAGENPVALALGRKCIDHTQGAAIRNGGSQLASVPAHHTN